MSAPQTRDQYRALYGEDVAQIYDYGFAAGVASQPAELHSALEIAHERLDRAMKAEDQLASQQAEIERLKRDNEWLRDAKLVARYEAVVEAAKRVRDKGVRSPGVYAALFDALAELEGDANGKSS